MEANRSRRCRPERFGLGRQAAPLVIVERGSLAELFFEDSDLFLKILDDALLVSVDPAGKANEQELEGIHTDSLSHQIAPDQIQSSLSARLAPSHPRDLRGFGHYGAVRTVHSNLQTHRSTPPLSPPLRSEPRTGWSHRQS